MMGIYSKIIFLALIVGALSYSKTLPSALDLSPEQMREVLDIAKTVHLAKSSLDDSKCLEYAVAIYKAAKYYKIEPNLLIAIASQETSFREDLPEGKAGEFGIVQIRKIWVNNQKFRNTFKKAKIKDLMKPAKAFLYAAWILHDLKLNSKKSAIPYWSYYNAKRFENRLKYYLAVNRKLAYLNRGQALPLMVAEDVQANGLAGQKAWKPDPFFIQAEKEWSPAPTKAVANYRTRETKPVSNTQERSKGSLETITTASLGGGIEIIKDGWIHLALKRLKLSENTNQVRNLSGSSTVGNKVPAKLTIEAQNDLHKRLLKSLQD